MKSAVERNNMAIQWAKEKPIHNKTNGTKIVNVRGTIAIMIGNGQGILMS